MIMRTSVVLSTYNGKKYIYEQLNSILSQNLKVDEVVICDDCSSDDTVDRVKKFIEDNTLENWHLYINEHNKGFIRNFLDGANLATGDVLFFSDQDDVWDQNKVSHMVDVFKNENALAVYCLANSIDSEGNTIVNRVSKFNCVPATGRIQKVTLCDKLKYARSPGLCLGFRREILNEVRNVALTYALPHDIPVGTVAAVKGCYYVLNEKLVSHRVHSNNVSNPDTALSNSFRSIDKQIKSREMKLKELTAIQDLYFNLLTSEEQKMLLSTISMTNKAICCLKDNKLLGMMSIVFYNNRMMNRNLAIRNLLAIMYNRIIRGK